MSDVEFKIPVFVADISDNGIIELTKSGKVLFANNKAKCIFGGIDTDKNIKDYIGDNEFFVFKKNIEISLYNQHPHSFYFENDNRFYNVYLYPSASSVWLGFNDITEKRQLSHLLQINFLRAVFSEKHAKSGYWELDLNKKQFYWSSGMYELFELDEKSTNIKKNLIKELILPQDLFIYKTELKKLLKTKSNISGFVRILTRNAKIKKCRFSADIFYENGEEKIAGVFVDMSDCKENECQKCKFLAKDYTCMMAKVVHDIRQPINVIKLLADDVKKYLPQKNEIVAKKLTESCNNLERMVTDILNLAKNNEIKYEKFDLKPFIEKICEEYEYAIKEKGIKIILRLNNFEVFQNKFWVEKIIRNLLDNAIKYTNSKIIIKNVASCFYIIDNGIGIEKDDQNHIFKDFFQCNTLSQKQNNGVGLGLAIVDFAASLINVKINIKSRVNGYTIFKVCL